MKDYKYEFNYTKENGYREATLPSKLQDKLFEHRKSSWRNKYVYFVNEKNGIIEMCAFCPMYLKIIGTLLYPVWLLLYGFSNYKEINKEISDVWNERERGKFSGDTISKTSNVNSDLYNEVLKNLKFKENK
ncbi:MAG: hypothetical protein ACRC6V_09135 [Bacteroidales bacterium]